jgi:hypothetical protein
LKPKKPPPQIKKTNIQFSSSHENPRLVSISDAQRWKLKISAFLNKKRQKRKKTMFQLFDFIRLVLFVFLFPSRPLLLLLFLFRHMCRRPRAPPHVCALSTFHLSKTKMDKRVFFYFMGVDAVRQPPWGGCRTGGCLGFFGEEKAKHPTYQIKESGAPLSNSKRHLWEKTCPQPLTIQEKRCFN